MLAAVLLTTATSCSSDDDSESQPLVPTATGARLQVMILFSPGQLGDQSYADNLLTGVSALESLESKGLAPDSVDVQFISLFSISDTKQALKNWAASANHPFYENSYERRLLILTEPFMIKWITGILSSLHSTDEVLIMKSDEAYIEKIASDYNLGNRVHGLNIDISPYIHMYCDYLRYMKEENLADFAGEYGISDGPVQVSVIRRYSEDQNYYCDHIEDIVKEDLGDMVSVVPTTLSKNVEDEEFADNMTFISAAFEFASLYDSWCRLIGYGFMISDLGTCNSGIDYHLIGRTEKCYDVLMIDANPSINGRMYVNRMPYYPISDWTKKWMQQAEGTMPAFCMYDSSNVESSFIQR